MRFRIVRRLCIGLLCLGWVATGVAAPNDPHYQAQGSWGQGFDDQWALKRLRVYPDDAQYSPTPAVVVAVVDTGVDFKHEDLAASTLWRNEREQPNGRDDDGNGYVDDLIGWNFVEQNNNPWDDSGHGTHIAGAIAACTNNGIGIAGVHPDARIMPLKVANFVGQARSADVAAAIYYAVDHGARIINLSLGGEVITDLERQAAQYAQARGVLIVVAAGNRGLSVEQFGYAALPGVLVVGASDQQGARAGFSNFGNELHVLAPGVDVLSLRAAQTDFIARSKPLDYPRESAVVGDDGNYYRASGTSFSAALVTGLASRMLAVTPSLTALDLAQMIMNSAKDVAPPGVDQLSGYGEADFTSLLTASTDQIVNARLRNARLDLADEQLWIDLSGTAGAKYFDRAELQIRAAPGSVVQAEPEERKESRRRSRRKSDSEREPSAQPDPYVWHTVAQLNSPVYQGLLARLNLLEITGLAGGSTEWEVRLQVFDANGASRDAQNAPEHAGAC